MKPHRRQPIHVCLVMAENNESEKAEEHARIQRFYKNRSEDDAANYTAIKGRKEKQAFRENWELLQKNLKKCKASAISTSQHSHEDTLVGEYTSG